MPTDPANRQNSSPRRVLAANLGWVFFLLLWLFLITGIAALVLGSLGLMQDDDPNRPNDRLHAASFAILGAGLIVASLFYLTLWRRWKNRPRGDAN